MPLITAGQVLLLDHARAVAQFAGLERRAFPSGKDRVDYPLNAHDDLSNAIALAAVLVSQDREQKVPLVAPLLVGQPMSIPGQQQSSTELYYACANGGGNANL